MRNTTALALLSFLLIGGALAQSAPSGVLTPAPVPSRDAGEVSPADRAGRPSGSEQSAPFSGLPSSMSPGAGQATPSTLGTTSRDTAPSPSLSR